VNRTGKLVGQDANEPITDVRLFDSAEDALRARKIRKTREQIWRGLAELEAARKQLPPSEVK
jgi:hypothetical protein